MNLRFIKAVLLCLCSFTITAKADPCSNLNSIEFMLGDWQYQSKSRKTMESWRRVSEQTFEGEGWSYLLTTPDQQQKETLRIVAMSGEVFYLAKVATNSLPVAFKLIECASTRAVFVNNEHDFPNKLVYVLRDANALTVEVTDNTGMGFTLNYLRSTSH